MQICSYVKLIVRILGFVWVCTAHADLFLCKTLIVRILGLIVRILGFVWVCTAHADLFLCKTFVLSHDLLLTIMPVVGTGVKIESRRIHIRN
jgi:hypothetical protein